MIRTDSDVCHDRLQTTFISTREGLESDHPNRDIFRCDRRAVQDLRPDGALVSGPKPLTAADVHALCFKELAPGGKE